MVLLRRLVGDTLRASRQAQHRTLREVSTAANVSLGYLSEVERGQKEASSELFAAICAALGLRVSDVLNDVSRSAALVEAGAAAEAVVHQLPAREFRAPLLPEAADVVEAETEASVVDGDVTVTVRRDSPLRTTLLARRLGHGRESVKAA